MEDEKQGRGIDKKKDKIQKDRRQVVNGRVG